MNRSSFLVFATLVSLVFSSREARSEEMTPEQRDQIVHVLNRVTFGPRPGDVEMVQKTGLDHYLDQQLHPETIDDSAVEKQLAQFPLLGLSETELGNLYVGYFRESELKRTQAMQAKISQEAGASAVPPVGKHDKLATEAGDSKPDMPPTVPQLALLSKYGNFRDAIAELEHAKLIRDINSPRQLQEVLVDFWSNHFNIDMKKNNCAVYKVVDDRDVIRPHILGKFRDLLEASAKSPAMLFYLDNAKSGVVRPLHSKKNYASNQAVATASPAGDDTMMTEPQQMTGGINENYAREIMELHTLGVDGGYTQKDVQEVARCFTGWTIDYNTHEFVFRATHHDNGAKVVLGQTIPAGGGIEDGEKVLDLLCAQPACAHFISRELCQRFVADNPPKALVDRVAGIFTKTGGDLRAVTTAILTSPEFLDPSTYRNKIKSPLEYAVSAVRASGAQYVETDPILKLKKGSAPQIEIESRAIIAHDNTPDIYSRLSLQSLNWHIATLGEPLFACTPPTGYKEVSTVWVNPGALIERLNFAQALTEQKILDVQFSADKVLGHSDLDDPEKVLHECVASLLQGHISTGTQKVLTEAALPEADASKTVNPTKLIALIIGSPEFQHK